MAKITEQEARAALDLEYIGGKGFTDHADAIYWLSELGEHDAAVWWAKHPSELADWLEQHSRKPRRA